MSSDKKNTPRGPLPSVIPQERPGPVGGKRDRNRRRRTRDLLDASLGLFLEHGVEAVTIDEIARRAGMAKGSFYRYFTDKKNIVEALFEPVHGLVIRAMDDCAAALTQAHDTAQLVQAYGVLGVALALAFQQHADEVRLYLQESRAPSVGARTPICDMASGITQRAIELTDIAHDHGMLRRVHPQVSALAVVGSIERLLHAALCGELEPDPARVSQELISLVLDGLRGDR